MRVCSHTTITVRERLFSLCIHHRSQRFLYKGTKRHVRIFNNGWGGGEIGVIICMRRVRKRDQSDVFRALLNARQICLAWVNRSPVIGTVVEYLDWMICVMCVTD